MSTLARRIASLVRIRVERSRSRKRALRVRIPAIYFLLPIALFVTMLWPGGCVTTSPTTDIGGSDRVIRARILKNQGQVILSATASPGFTVSDAKGVRKLNLVRNTGYSVVLTSRGWRIGNTHVGGGTLSLMPAGAGTLLVNGRAYRGQYRLIPTSADRFDVVNDVDIDDYLKGVLPRELLSGFHYEAYKAQAIVARTYALYEKHTAGRRAGRAYDVNADQSSQVYGGMSDESEKSRRAVDETAGIVVAYGPPGKERIFKAYFSACCGGITQSVTDAFGEPHIEALGDQDARGLCSACPKFTWGPIVVDKKTLTERVRGWGADRGRYEKDMGLITRIEPQANNRFGRPVRFAITDNRGLRYSLGGEEFRWACNFGAPESQRLLSSFVSIINDSDSIRFVDGHGFGHGVGMCQWCANARAVDRLRHEDIVLAAYPKSRLCRAY